MARLANRELKPPRRSGSRARLLALPDPPDWWGPIHGQRPTRSAALVPPARPPRARAGGRPMM